jgi:NAD(P)-dependent dehydrogenase (short-subunit alcohol dehydrogenase family)
MFIQLSGKTAVITGGASGIGKAIALLFAKAGAHIHVVDLSGSEGVVKEISESKGIAVGYSCDVSSQDDIAKLISSIAKQSAIEILVNCAGIAHVGNIEETSVADIERLFNVNVKGVYNTMHACIGHMKERRRGIILNMASVAGTLGIPDRFAYSMTKGAVIAMTMSVARDYIQDGIRCNSISPARIHTPFVDGFLAKNYAGKENEMFEALSKTQPIGRMGTPDEVAKLALFLCSDEAGFITGSDYPIDGGFIKLSAG